MSYETPHFIIKKNLQKSQTTGRYFSDVTTDEILEDVCYRITGKREYTCTFVDNDYSDEFLEPTYNKGRMALMHYNDYVFYISFSEKEIAGRNSGVQSVPTAYNLFYSNPYPKKRLCYYFLKDIIGNPETDYYLNMYRLMETIGFEFLNPEVISSEIKGFNTVQDVANSRKETSERNSSNNSTYITTNGDLIEIYGKTYGANKYATSMITYAIGLLAATTQKIKLYEIIEQDLKELPKSSLDVIMKMGNIDVIKTDIQLEKKAFEEGDSLRSPRYIFNLLNKMSGRKKCAFCNCEIPEIIQGAHVWPVADIKKQPFTYEKKLSYATDGDNGLWLCENHHKLFDRNIIKISNTGHIQYITSESKHITFMKKITEVDRVPDEYINDTFMEYLERRNMAI